MKIGSAYVDVGTIRGYRQAINLLSSPPYVPDYESVRPPTAG
jgi:hypothetical protein